MIFLCEPICRDFSHEKVNSGFISAFHESFPDDEICVFARPDHLKALLNILKIDSVNSRFISIPVKFGNPNSLLSFFISFINFYLILKKVKSEKENKIFMLSYNRNILFTLKFFKKNIKEFSDIEFRLVLHGSFEGLKFESEHYEKQELTKLEVNSLNQSKSLKEKIKKNGLKKSIFIGFDKVFIKLRRYVDLAKILDILMPSEKDLMFENDPSFKFLALSPHIKDKAQRLFPDFKIDWVYLPTNFKKSFHEIENKTLKLAIFGYGNFKNLNKLALKLQKFLSDSSFFEIIIIGMDDRLTDGFSFIKCVSPGVPLTRQQMEFYLPDIDAFLILYDSGSYELSCSGSIYEAISYEKPIFHLNNACINYYNSLNCPIGVSADSIDELGEKINYYAINYCEFLEKRIEYKQNIRLLKEKVSFKSNILSFKKLIR